MNESETLSAQAAVYLIGAGPGDPGLLTLRAKELLETADAVVYDYLSSDAVRRFSNPDAKQVFVGKKGFSQHVTQEEINTCLIQLARSGYRRIARLKGGDPFVFGRGGEEALALQEAGIAFEVVPGVTAGVAAPAYAGIPVTHRGVASSVTLVTGHETPEKSETAIDWASLAQQGGTLCFYMGVRDLPMIVSRLVDGGRAPETPVALVRWGTTPQQEVLTATLDTVVQEVQRRQFKAPAIIVVGEVVSLRQQLAWFDQRPLWGKRIVNTRTRQQASELTACLSALGAEVVELPTISIHPRPVDGDLRDCIGKLAGGAYRWVVFTSVNGVSCFFDMLAGEGYDARVFGGAKVAAIGPATASALSAHGIQADLVPTRFVAESVVDALCNADDIAGAQILIPRASAAREVLPQVLRQQGAAVDVAAVYDTVAADASAQAADVLDMLRAGSVDAVTFTSSSTAANFSSLLRKLAGEDELAQLLQGVTCAAIGPVTAETMRANRIPVSVQADTYTIPGLVDALRSALQDERMQP